MDRHRFALFLIFIASLAWASDATPSAHLIAQANENRLAAGELKRGTLSLQMDMMPATWYPEQEGGSSLSVYWRSFWVAQRFTAAIEPFLDGGLQPLR